MSSSSLIKKLQYNIILILDDLSSWSLSNYYMKFITNLEILYLFTSLLGMDIDASMCVSVCYLYLLASAAVVIKLKNFLLSFLSKALRNAFHSSEHLMAASTFDSPRADASDSFFFFL
jgi:hypothetical protein